GPYSGGVADQAGSDPGKTNRARGTGRSGRSRRAGKAGTNEETRLGVVRRARRTFLALTEAYPDAHCELDLETPVQVPVAAMLSGQCTDKRVNAVTPALFARYPTAADYAGADRAELEEMVRSTGFYRNKANSLLRLGADLLERHAGEVPDKLEDLVRLPGVGR